MPMPKPKNVNDLSINGKKPKRMIKIVKPYKKDIPDLYNQIEYLSKKKIELDKKS